MFNHHRSPDTKKGAGRHPHLADPSATMLFGQLCGHVHAVIGVGFDNFVLRALLLGLCSDLGFSTVQGGVGCRHGLGEATEGDEGQNGNCNESFDRVHG